mmetsp:Transcript_19481/g.26759  ORF Transcript_19481/g.26759 Transcript_19481/m.26759 type:complete len:298 (+) Transcript_19481:246-1139(+)
MLDDFFSHSIAINPSVDCDTMNYHRLMRALNLMEEKDLAKVADELDLQTTIKSWCFNWSEHILERHSYPSFQAYLKNEWNINAIVVAEGERFAGYELIESVIFTLPPQSRDYTNVFNIHGRETSIRFLIKGNTDLAVFNEGGVLSCTDLLWAMVVKREISFFTKADINQALREGVLQLIGMNADNQYSSPSVIVTSFMHQHYILYLDRERVQQLNFRYHLRVRKTVSLVAAIAFVQERSKLSISGHFASPPFLSNFPQNSFKNDVGSQNYDDDDDYDDSNVQLISAEELEEDCDVKI